MLDDIIFPRLWSPLPAAMKQPASLYRLSPNEAARLVQEERENRRKLRLIQVSKLGRFSVPWRIFFSWIWAASPVAISNTYMEHKLISEVIDWLTFNQLLGNSPFHEISARWRECSLLLTAVKHSVQNGGVAWSEPGMVRGIRVAPVWGSAPNIFLNISVIMVILFIRKCYITEGNQVFIIP